MQRLNAILTELSKISAVSGDEYMARPFVAELRKFADAVTQLSGGGIVALKKSGKPNAKKILLDAHLDQIGLIVTEIDKNGFIHFCNHAGVDNKILPAAEVTVYGQQPFLGVIGTKPPHLLTAEERKKPLGTAEMTIDVGLTAEQIGSRIRVGDKIALNGNLTKMLNHCMTGRSLDDRAGCAILVSILEMFRDRLPENDLYFSFSSGEEFGGYGATAAVLEICPDEVIVLDVSHADMPAARKEDCGKLGGGAMIGVSPILDRGLTDNLLTLAKERQIPYQVEAMGSSTGTNADNIVPLCGGIPTALVSIPLRYMHTANEIISLEDLVSVRAILLAYLFWEAR